MSLLKHWQLTGKLRFAIHLTKCIVRDPPSEDSKKKLTTYLLVPTNPTLTSTTLFPYFQRGGPSIRKISTPPASNSSSQWGGMEAGSEMIYPIQTVDGVVYMDGGPEYRNVLDYWRHQIDNDISGGIGKGGRDNNMRLGEGGGVHNLPEFLICPSKGLLKSVGYDKIIHVSSPVYKESDSRMLFNCYMNGFLAAGLYGGEPAGDLSTCQSLVTPLVGAGCRGWPVELAANEAVRSIQELAKEGDYGDKNKIVNLVVVDRGVASVVLEISKQLFGSHISTE